jgi:hypothetical protein
MCNIQTPARHRMEIILVAAEPGTEQKYFRLLPYGNLNKLSAIFVSES